MYGTSAMNQNKPLQFDNNGCWVEQEEITTPVGTEFVFITLGMDKPEPPLELLKDEPKGRVW